MSNEYFTEHYKKPGIPVIFDGWLNHTAPDMAKWDLLHLADVCGDMTVSFAQRRAHFLQELNKTLGSGMTSRAFDVYMSQAFNATLGELLVKETLNAADLERLAAQF